MSRPNQLRSSRSSTSPFPSIASGSFSPASPAIGALAASLAASDGAAAPVSPAPRPSAAVHRRSRSEGDGDGGEQLASSRPSSRPRLDQDSAGSAVSVSPTPLRRNAGTRRSRDRQSGDDESGLRSPSRSFPRLPSRSRLDNDVDAGDGVPDAMEQKNHHNDDGDDGQEQFVAQPAVASAAAHFLNRLQPQQLLQQPASPSRASGPSQPPAAEAMVGDLFGAITSMIRQATAGFPSGKNTRTDSDDESSADTPPAPLTHSALAEANAIVTARANRWRNANSGSSRSDPLYPPHVLMWCSSTLPSVHSGNPSAEWSLTHSVTPSPWCITAVTASPPFGGVFPFRLEDRGRRSQEARKAVASGSFIQDVPKMFSRAATSSAASRSLVETVLGSFGAQPEAPPRHASSSSASSASSPSTGSAAAALEWIAAMHRYCDALTLLFPNQRDGMFEYIRFIGDLSAVVPFERLVVFERHWREGCATMGTPINSWMEAYRAFGDVLRPSHSMAFSSSAAASSSSSSSSDRSAASSSSFSSRPSSTSAWHGSNRGRGGRSSVGSAHRSGGDDRAGDRSFHRGAHQSPASESLQRQQICFRWNDGFCADRRQHDGSPCFRRHVCAKCNDSSHCRRDCPSQNSFPPRPGTMQGDAPPSVASSSSSFPPVSASASSVGQVQPPARRS